MHYRGPAGVVLSEDEWYVIYLALLPLNGDAARAIRREIRDFLMAVEHPGVCNEIDT